MQITYSSVVNRDDWNAVLQQAELANVFHTPEYFDIQTALGHKLLYSCCYVQNEPIGIIVGVVNDSGYHQGIIEIGTKSGGLPLIIPRYDQSPRSREIKNRFIEHFAQQHFSQQQRLIFYSCFHLDECVLDDFSRTGDFCQLCFYHP